MKKRLERMREMDSDSHASSSDARSSAVPCGLAAFVTLVSLIALAGWHAGEEAWHRVVPGLAPMQPGTAIGLLFLALAVLAERAAWRRLSIGSGAVGALIGTLTLVAYLVGVPTGVDQLGMPPGRSNAELFPGRMAPNTAACFVLLGAGIVLLVARFREPATSGLPVPLGAAALGVVALSLAEYLLRSKPTYGWGSTTRMAVNTSACLCGLSVALLGMAQRWKRPFRRSAWVAPVGFLLAFGTATLWSLWDRHENDRLRARTEGQLRSVEEALTGEIAARERELTDWAERLQTTSARDDAIAVRDLALYLAGRGGYLGLFWSDPSRAQPILVTKPRGSGALRRDDFERHRELGIASRARPGVVSHLDKHGRLVFVHVPHPERRAQAGVLVGLVDPREWLGPLRAFLDKDVELRVLYGEHVLLGESLPGDSPYEARSTSRLLGEAWAVTARPSRTLVAASYSPLRVGMLVAGLVLSVLGSLVQQLRHESSWLASAREDDLRQLNLILDQLSDGVVVADRTGRFLLFNRPAQKILGLGPQAAKVSEWSSIYGFYALDGCTLYPPDQLPVARAMRGESCDHVELAFRSPARDDLGYLSASARPLLDADGWVTGGVVVFRDVTDLKRAQREQIRMEAHLRQAQKLEAVGQLAAGIAHEMNTPAQYVNDNLRFLRDAYEEIVELLQHFEALSDCAREGVVPPGALAKLTQALDDADFEFLLTEIPASIAQSQDGILRVSAIVRAMKEFSHPGSIDKETIDLERALESTLTVARSEWRHVAEVETEIDPDMREITVVPGEFNQVILNLVVNAAHAIASVPESQRADGRIRIRSWREGEWGVIAISDTGPGIPDEVRSRIFDPFFTTKEVGQGTGQGLAIVRSIVVDKHGGTLTVHSEPGSGATFEIRVPMHGAPLQRGDPAA